MRTHRAEKRRYRTSSVGPLPPHGHFPQPPLRNHHAARPRLVWKLHPNGPVWARQFPEAETARQRFARSFPRIVNGSRPNRKRARTTSGGYRYQVLTLLRVGLAPLRIPVIPRLGDVPSVAQSLFTLPLAGGAQHRMGRFRFRSVSRFSPSRTPPRFRLEPSQIQDKRPCKPSPALDAL